ncbi:hypothetical protein QAD02_004145 [Eretmocerus hayati]|uniref:Uncharacterized protein n=1 Tax=Eretmocerus hayati TaxID=131215 RepID=A0ACC2NP76_9HYME|nr:hypothetical protein QAD02_004145 [Eretmocerus hayati]
MNLVDESIISGGGLMRLGNKSVRINDPLTLAVSQRMLLMNSAIPTLCCGLVRDPKQLLEGSYFEYAQPTISTSCTGALSDVVLPSQKAATRATWSRRRRLTVGPVQQIPQL